MIHQNWKCAEWDVAENLIQIVLQSMRKIVKRFSRKKESNLTHKNIDLLIVNKISWWSKVSEYKKKLKLLKRLRKYQNGKLNHLPLGPKWNRIEEVKFLLQTKLLWNKQKMEIEFNANFAEENLTKQQLQDI